MKIILQKTRFLEKLIFVFVLTCAFSAAHAEDMARSLYKKNSEYLYQIKVVELVSNKKSSIGSGFLVSANGLVATNYHVISSYIQNPGKYRIEFIAQNNERSDLTVEDIDVVNDLALLKSDISSETFLELSPEMPGNGEFIYSLGNPQDLGSAVVPGTYNGYIASSFYKRIHFTGSLNPGMSGGPVLNQAGTVIGINVATSGNQISYLISVNKLKALMDEYVTRKMPPKDFNNRIHEQLIANQKKLMDNILSADWGKTSLGDTEVLSKLSEFVSCWGTQKDQKKEDKYSAVSIDCQMKEDIFIDRFFNTGKVGYQYKWLQSISLNPVQFYSLIERFYARVFSGNRAEKDDVHPYKCNEAFISGPDQRVVFCSRAYKDYAGLYDVVLVSTTVHKNDRALLSYFSMSGIEKDPALRFAERFLGETKWN
ncbi:MAG: trypsin-like peptidase domain-containing protein [Gammaproteobacteria bacterium]|nr:trypsin-like peptidase domain-containing protein [Gammaproteobacteria bacterium]